MYKLCQLSLLMSVSSFAAGLATAEIEGLWKHDDKAVWVQLTVEEGEATGTLRRSDENPDAAGRIIFKKFLRDGNKADLWKGLSYVKQLGEFRKAQINLVDDNSMELNVKVGFISRTVTWSRVELLPD